MISISPFSWNGNMESFIHFSIFSVYPRRSIIEDVSKKEKLVTVVEGNSKAPFSIATTPRCWGWHYSFPWIASLYP